jgi:hypothetical protein
MQDQPFQLSFNVSLKGEFRGSRVTADGDRLRRQIRCIGGGRSVRCTNQMSKSEFPNLVVECYMPGKIGGFPNKVSN